MTEYFNNITMSIIFTTIVGVLLNLAGYATYTLISPEIFVVGQGLLVIAIGLANTPALKGVAVAGFAGWLFLYLLQLNIPLPSPMKEIVYGVLFVPTFLTVGFAFLEMGKG